MRPFFSAEDIHEIVNSSGLPASISIGLGVDGESFEESYDFAALGIEMALSRGGDQAVIKDRVNFNFYGGRNREADYRSKVRSRVTANSLMELIGQSGRVFIMGHKNADLDAVGAAMGISCLCRKRGKKANIVIDLENNAAGKLIEEIQAVPEYRDVFVSGQDALLMADNRSILVVVDTNRPDQVECRPLPSQLFTPWVSGRPPSAGGLYQPRGGQPSRALRLLGGGAGDGGCLVYAVKNSDRRAHWEAESLMAASV